MRALVTRGVGDVVVADVPEPVGDETVLLAVDAVGICGSDLGILRGSHPYARYPLVQGHEVAAHVLDPGSSGLAPGAPVVVDPVIGCGRCGTCRRGAANVCPDLQVVGVHRPGALAERLRVPAGCVVPVDPEVPAVAAVLAEPVAVALRAVQRLGPGIDGELVVIGAGSIGRAVALVARERGLGVTVVDRDDARLEVALGLGATTVVRSEDSRALARIAARGLRHAVDAVGVPETLATACALLAPGGLVVTLGVARAPIDLPVGEMSRKELTIVGSRNSRGDLPEAVRLVRRHHGALAATVSHVVPLQAAPAMLTALVTGLPGAHKVVVAPDGRAEAARTTSGMMVRW